jgi:hypothetical protein
VQQQISLLLAISSMIFGTACFKLAFSFTMYSLKYSSAASPGVVLVMGEGLFALPTILVVMVLFSQ